MMTRKTFIGTGLACILLVCHCPAFGQSKDRSKEQTLAYTTVSTLPGYKPKASKTWVKGTKWRSEDTVEGKLVRIEIYSEGWFYTLFPETKTGSKQKLSKDRDSLELLSFNPFLKYAQKRGAKKTGKGKLNGQECDIYEIPRSKTKIWVRKKDGWVVKEEGEFVLGRCETEVKDLKVGVPVDDSLFVLPGGYKLEEK